MRCARCSRVLRRRAARSCRQGAELTGIAHGKMDLRDMRLRLRRSAGDAGSRHRAGHEVKRTAGRLELSGECIANLDTEIVARISFSMKRRYTRATRRKSANS